MLVKGGKKGRGDEVSKVIFVFENRGKGEGRR